MAKSYTRGADVYLYYDTAASFGSPTWALIKACGDIKVDPNFDDVQVPERSSDMGHMHGEKDWSFEFDLFEDTGDSNVVTLITAMWAGTQVHLGVTNGAVATSGTKLVHGECVLFASADGNRADPHTYKIKASKHANSSNNLTRATI